MTATSPQQIKTALLSVSDKTGLADFARFLAEQGIRLISTGGSAAEIRRAGIEVTDVADITGFPEIMDGRVKTLHPHIHGGILARRDTEGHLRALDEHQIGPIDMVVLNLYPFAQTIARTDDAAEAIENIDIGGPAMLRAAAKNHEFVTILTDPSDYDEAARRISEQGGIDLEFRVELARKAFSMTAQYDAMIAQWMAGRADIDFPEKLSLSGTRSISLRYGENPHQKAAFYQTATSEPGVGQARQMQGKELSYNNINDTDAAFRLASEFTSPTIAIIKHANPCGVASAPSLSEAWEAALAADPVSAFGGIIAANQHVDGQTAEMIASIFSEVIIAPDASDEALEVFASKPNLRVLLTGQMADPARPAMAVKSVLGGYLVQNRDNGIITADDVRIVTKAQPDQAQWDDMMMAWKIAKHVKSNAIVYVKDGVSAAIGAGQMSRVDSCRIAAQKAGDMAAHHGWPEPRTIGSAVASDAFFPFADGLLAAVEAGAKAVIQPGGSRNDADVIAAADEAGITMGFTGMRHFNH